MRIAARVTMPRHMQYGRVTWPRAIGGVVLAGLWLTAIVMVLR